MANHDSAKKSIRQTLTRTLVRKSRMSRIKTFVKKVESAIKAGDQSVANREFHAAQSEMMRGVTKGVLKLNTASRKISRLCTKIKAMHNA